MHEYFKTKIKGSFTNVVAVCFRFVLKIIFVTLLKKITEGVRESSISIVLKKNSKNR